MRLAARRRSPSSGRSFVATHPHKQQPSPGPPASHTCAHSLGRRHQGPGSGRNEPWVGQVWAGTPSLLLGRLPKGPWGPGNVQSCARIPVPRQRRAFPDREVTICAASPFPGPAAPGLAHLQHLLGNPTSLVPPGAGGGGGGGRGGGAEPLLPLAARVSSPPPHPPPTPSGVSPVSAPLSDPSTGSHSLPTGPFGWSPLH